MLKKNQKKIIIANWKMNPATEEGAKSIFLGIRKVAETLKKIEVVVAPPFLYVSNLLKIKRKKVNLALQDCYFEDLGSHTGEVSPLMAVNMGIKYVIVGHSERRAMGETSDLISKKVKAVINNNLCAVLCVGEQERGNEGKYLDFIRNQISESLSGVTRKYLDQIVIAYEPVWAVGQKNYAAMSPRDLHETVLFIRRVLAELYGKDWISRIPILYGGSVNLENAEDILFEGEVQGLLVGRQSLETKEFGEILKIADKK